MDNIANANINLEGYIPKDLCKIIAEEAATNEHFDNVYRVAKWGKIEERAFLSTYGEVLEGYIPEDEERRPKNDIGTYSISVYTERKSCDKFINMLKGKLRKKYPCPIVIRGKTSNGFVQRTIERKPNYPNPTHVDWWLFKDKREVILKDFVLCDCEMIS